MRVEVSMLTREHTVSCDYRRTGVDVLADRNLDRDRLVITVLLVLLILTTALMAVLPAILAHG